MIHPYVDRDLARLIEAEGLGNLDWFAYQNDRVHLYRDCAGATLAPGVDLAVQANPAKTKIDNVCLVKADAGPDEYPLMVARFSSTEGMLKHLEAQAELATQDLMEASQAMEKAERQHHVAFTALGNLQPMKDRAVAQGAPVEPEATTDPDPESATEADPDPTGEYLQRLTEIAAIISDGNDNFDPIPF